MKDEPLLEDFKSHIQFEDDMDDTMLVNYLAFARRFVQTATGKQSHQMILMVAALLNDFRVSEKDLGDGLESLTPFLLSEVFADDETVNEQDTP